MIFNNRIVCHTCDNPPCCNPAHLVAETETYNMRDKIRKGRGNVAHGEAHKSAKLTDNQVREIKALADKAEMSQSAIGKLYGVAQGTVHKIKICVRRKYALKIKPD